MPSIPALIHILPWQEQEAIAFSSFSNISYNMNIIKIVKKLGHAFTVIHAFQQQQWQR